MQISSVRCRVKRCNIRFCVAGRTRTISRAQRELSQPVSNKEGKVHWAVSFSPFRHRRPLPPRLETRPQSQAFIQRRPSMHDRHSSRTNHAPQERSGLCCGRLEPTERDCDRFHPASNFALQSSPDRYWHLWVSCPCRPVRYPQPLLLLCLPCRLHRHQGQLLPAAGLELLRLPIRDNSLAKLLKSK
jgi:hypothetical protein